MQLKEKLLAVLLVAAMVHISMIRRFSSNIVLSLVSSFDTKAGNDQPESDTWWLDFDVIPEIARPELQDGMVDSREIDLLWYNRADYPSDIDGWRKNMALSLVLTYCKGDLMWLKNYLEGFDFQSIMVIAKCGISPPAENLPDKSQVVELPNVGGCDHTMAYWMAEILPNLAPEAPGRKEIILFLKDTMHVPSGEEPRDLATILTVASTHGFGCVAEGGRDFLELSYYHETDTLEHYKQDHEYKRGGDGAATKLEEEESFKSGFASLGGWHSAMGIHLPRPLAPVCYGGMYAVQRSRIEEVPSRVFRSIERSLERGNNIEEGHFAERTWAGLLSPPLAKEKVQVLLYRSRMVYPPVDSSFTGALMKFRVANPTEKNLRRAAGQLQKNRSPIPRTKTTSEDEEDINGTDPIVVDSVEFDRLWYNRASSTPIDHGGYTHGWRKNMALSLVLTYCKGDLLWLKNYLEGFDFQSIMVIAKCGISPPAENLPDKSQTFELPNVGGCDHTMAYWMAEILPNLAPEAPGRKEIILFLKDTMHVPGGGGPLRDLATILTVASTHGFGCAVEGGFTHELSFYHNTHILEQFGAPEGHTHIRGGGHVSGHHSHGGGAATKLEEEESFKSGFSNLGAWHSAMGIHLPRPLAPVCYGGMYAVQRSRIEEVPNSVFRRIAHSLERGNNIEEGHFAERTWAGLLSPPLPEEEVKLLLQRSPMAYPPVDTSYTGALMKFRVPNVTTKTELHRACKKVLAARELTKRDIVQESTLVQDSRVLDGEEFDQL